MGRLNRNKRQKDEVDERMMLSYIKDFRGAALAYINDPNMWNWQNVSSVWHSVENCGQYLSVIDFLGTMIYRERIVQFNEYKGGTNYVKFRTDVYYITSSKIIQTVFPVVIEEAMASFDIDGIKTLFKLKSMPQK